MFLPSTAPTPRDEESDMFPITLRKPSVAIPAIVLLAIVYVAATPAVTEFITVAPHGIHKLLSARYLGEPGLGSVVFVPGVLFLLGVMSGLASSMMGISGARWRSSPSKSRG
jgi:hypothetical protein